MKYIEINDKRVEIESYGAYEERAYITISILKNNINKVDITYDEIQDYLNKNVQYGLTIYSTIDEEGTMSEVEQKLGDYSKLMACTLNYKAQTVSINLEKPNFENTSLKELEQKIDDKIEQAPSDVTAPDLRKSIQIIASKLLDNSDLLRLPISIFDEWDSNNHEYKFNDVVIYNGKLYKVFQDHNSSISEKPDKDGSYYYYLVK